MSRRILAGLVLACATSLGLGLAVTAPAHAATGFPIRNTGNGYCLQTTGGTADIGSPVVQEPCTTTGIGFIQQSWTFNHLSDGTEQIVNLATGNCLDARGGAASGTPVQQWTCGPNTSVISNEKWTTGTPLPVISEVVSHVSGTASFCLDDPSQSKQPGQAMQIFACNATSAQEWIIG
jgi:hypothetical protein